MKVFWNTEQLNLGLEWTLQAVSNRCEYANLAHFENESTLKIFMNDIIWASTSWHHNNPARGYSSWMQWSMEAAWFLLLPLWNNLHPSTHLATLSDSQPTPACLFTTKANLSYQPLLRANTWLLCAFCSYCRRLYIDKIHCVCFCRTEKSVFPLVTILRVTVTLLIPFYQSHLWSLFAMSAWISVVYSSERELWWHEVIIATSFSTKNLEKSSENTLYEFRIVSMYHCRWWIKVIILLKQEVSKWLPQLRHVKDWKATRQMCKPAVKVNFCL